MKQRAGVNPLFAFLLGMCVSVWAGTAIDIQNSDKTFTPVQGVSGQQVLAALACERNIGSSTGTDYCATAGEWQATLINTNATGDITVYNGPAIVRIVRVRNTTNAGAATTNTAGIILVKDGTTVKDGAAAAKTPGTTIYDGLDGTVFRTSFIVNFASGSDNPASDGKIEALWKPAGTISY